MGTAPVGVFVYDVSPFGVLDMAGNVSEWVADRYDAEYYYDSPSRNPTGPSVGSGRVVRGGSFTQGWGVHLQSNTTTARYGSYESSLAVGFRCAIGTDS